MTPNVQLAQAAGLEVDDGIRVDASLRTSQPDIYAAGDVASVFNPALNQWCRVEHADNANSTGGYAGVAMTGRTASYDYLPFFYSDIFDIAYEAVGEVDARLEMVEEWKIPLKEGVVYYLRDGRVRGMLCWNIYGPLIAGRLRSCRRQWARSPAREWSRATPRRRGAWCPRVRHGDTRRDP